MAKKTEDGFNLSFLDVMACGLGAVLLILIVVKFSAHTSTPSEEIEKLKEELAAQQDKQQEIKKSIDTVNDNIAMEVSTIEATKRQIEILKVQQDANKRALENKKAIKANIEQANAAAAEKQKDDPIRMDGTGEENYLIGLKVEGKNIGIMIDTSASMASETLIGAVRNKHNSSSVRKTQSKWKRTVRIAKWILARAPKSAKVSTVSFNDKAKFLTHRPINSVKAKSSVEKLAKAIDQLVPENGTNLQAGLQVMGESMPNMTDLYIITDGLPTLGKEGSGLSMFSDCKSFFGKSKTISGECRINLFNYSVTKSAPRGVRVNIILLPLEGDTGAPAAYWQWAVNTGGTFISPAGTWP